MVSSKTKDQDTAIEYARAFLSCKSNVGISKNKEGEYVVYSGIRSGDRELLAECVASKGVKVFKK